MNWKLRLFRSDVPDEEGMREELAAQKEQALQALQASKQALEQARSHQPEVSRVSRSLREMRQKNHFAEMIQQTFREST
jgi:enamine deaminase RidA (YjgF/YER057c/UK114 family)